LPLTDLLADCLRSWHRETMYARPTDWIFASTRSKGRKPRSSSMLTSDHLRPAAIAAGVKLKKVSGSASTTCGTDWLVGW
jgi:hypothetical protein